MASIKSPQDLRRHFHLIIEFCSTGAEPKILSAVDRNPGFIAAAVGGRVRRGLRPRMSRNCIRMSSWVAGTFYGRFEAGSSVAPAGRVRQEGAP